MVSSRALVEQNCSHSIFALGSPRTSPPSGGVRWDQNDTARAQDRAGTLSTAQSIWSLAQRITARGLDRGAATRRGLELAPFEGTETGNLVLLQVLLLLVYLSKEGVLVSSFLRKKHRREMVEPHDSLKRSKRRGMVGDEFVRTRFVLVTPSRADGLREYSTIDLRHGCDLQKEGGL